jgi:predicted nucleic acid-binding protein
VILVDTNVLVALVDKRDGHHARAARDLRRARGKALFVIEPVLSEACFLLPDRVARRRLRFLFDALSIRRLVLEEPWRDEVFAWLDRYATHEPDFADAQLVVAASRNPRAQIWTYDREFKTTWRRPNGGHIAAFGT